MADTEEWRRVAALSDIPADAGLPVTLGGTPIALYCVGDAVHAIDDVCPHAFALLSQGFVEGGTVECPLHQACFEIATGRCLSGPATVDLRSYAVKVDGGDVYVRAS